MKKLIYSNVRTKCILISYKSPDRISLNLITNNVFIRKILAGDEQNRAQGELWGWIKKWTYFSEKIYRSKGFPGGAVINNQPANAGDTRDMGLIPGSERYPGVGNGYPLQYSCLENSMDRGVWWATVHGVGLSNWACTHTHTDTHWSKSSQSFALETF